MSREIEQLATFTQEIIDIWETRVRSNLSDRLFDMQSNDLACIFTIRLHLLAAAFVKLNDWKVRSSRPGCANAPTDRTLTAVNQPAFNW